MRRCIFILSLLMLLSPMAFAEDKPVAPAPEPQIPEVQKVDCNATLVMDKDSKTSGRVIFTDKNGNIIVVVKVGQ